MPESRGHSPAVEAQLALAVELGGLLAWEGAPDAAELRLLGSTRELFGADVPGRWEAIDALVHPDDLATYRATRRGVRQSGGYHATFRIVRPDTGAVASMEERARIVEDAANGGARVVGVIRRVEPAASGADLEVVRLTAALKACDDELRTLYEVLPVGVFTAHDPLCRVITCNRAGAEMLRLPTADTNPSMTGPEADSLPFRTFRDGREVAPEDLPMQRCTATGRSIVGEELQVVFPDGMVTTLHESVSPLFDVEGSVRGCIGAFVDISERKRAEDALHRSERLYRAIGESINYGVWVTDRDGRNIYASDCLLRLVGLTQEEFSDFGWARVVHPDEAEATLAAWQRGVRAGTFWEWSHRVRGVDGRYYQLMTRGLPIRGPDGEIECWAGFSLDITALKRAEEALREADRRKDEFLATLAHELRNPLAPIRNAVEVLQRIDHADARVQWGCGVIDRQLRHLSRLVDDLLEVSRISRGVVELRRERVPLQSILEQALETCRPLFDRFGHQVRVAAPGEPVLVDVDPTRMAQVVANLLHNAAKYTPPGGHIDVTITCEGDAVALVVRDDGVGIPADKLGEIFTMFAQIDTSVERAHGGLGIGLTIARMLVGLHGGTLEARSAGPDQGSEFIVRLPRATGERAGSVEPEQRARSPGPGRRVLVVDDNADAADSLALLLELEGHQVSVCHDGASALARARASRPEVVLLDLGMPVISGYEVARQLRAELGAAVMLVAVTGWGHADDRRRTREAGFDHHLVKPLSLEQLRAVLAGERRPPGEP